MSALFSARPIVTRVGFRYVYGHAGGERSGLRLVPSETVAVDGALLDGRQHGDDDTLDPVAGVALPLAHNEIPAGVNDDRRFLGDDAVVDVLGKSER